MKTVRSFETSGNANTTTQRHIPDDANTASHPRRR